jgi:hypothetical protein
MIDGERIPAPVLIGHSMAGGEITAVGHEHSDRLGGIVYQLVRGLSTFMGMLVGLPVSRV